MSRRSSIFSYIHHLSNGHVDDDGCGHTNYESDICLDVRLDVVQKFTLFCLHMFLDINYVYLIIIFSNSL